MNLNPHMRTPFHTFIHGAAINFPSIEYTTYEGKFLTAVKTKIFITYISKHDQYNICASRTWHGSQDCEVLYSFNREGNSRNLSLAKTCLSSICRFLGAIGPLDENIPYRNRA